MSASDFKSINNVTGENITNTSMATSEETPIMLPIGVRIPIITMISFAIVFSNAINISILRTISQIPVKTKLFLTNLSCADLMIGLFPSMPSIGTAILGRWPYGIAWCQISASMHVVAASVSIWSLTFVSVDRYIAIKRPLHYPRLMTRRRCTIMVMLTWFLAFIYAVIPLFLRIPEFVYYQYNTAELLCDYSFDYRWLTIGVVMFIIFPAAGILIATTVSIIRATSRLPEGRVTFDPNRARGQMLLASAAREALNQTQENQGNIHRERTQVNTNKAIHILVLATLIYVIVWTPYVIKMIFYSVTVNAQLPVWTEFIVIWISNSNSFVNVFIYSFIYSSFRDRAKHLMVSLAMCQFDNLMSDAASRVG